MFDKLFCEGFGIDLFLAHLDDLVSAYNATFGGICNAAVSHNRILNSTKRKIGNTIAAQPIQLPLNPETYLNMNNAG